MWIALKNTNFRMHQHIGFQLWGAKMFLRKFCRKSKFHASSENISLSENILHENQLFD